mgnify:CR=1 FL=1
MVPGELALVRMPTSVERLRALRSAGIGAVVCLATDAELWPFWGGPISYERAARSEGLEVLMAPTPPGGAPGPAELLRMCRWIERRVRSGRAVAVHCFAGVGRSGAVAAAYLVYERGMDPDSAIGEVRRARPGAVETPEQEEAVREFHSFLMAAVWGDVPPSLALNPPSVGRPGILRRARAEALRIGRRLARALPIP